MVLPIALALAVAGHARAELRCSLDGAVGLGGRIDAVREKLAGPAPAVPAAAGRDWRPLTPGEIILARRVFQNGIAYPKTRIYRRKWLPWQPDGTVMSPNGHVYFPPGHRDYRDDFSTNSDSARKTFFHELTHVYQRHQGVDVAGRRLREGGIYDYDIATSLDLNRYTVEQQGDIVADYAARCAELSGAALLSCQARFRPALTEFLADPNYLRADERKRFWLERWGVP
ncbi:MAG: hypothetical protein HY553_19725 [Elusimicrobia bacterium]|nr:hypothetical protein [Elusimicrobiota bacterium]